MNTVFDGNNLNRYFIKHKRIIRIVQWEPGYEWNDDKYKTYFK